MSNKAKRNLLPGIKESSKKQAEAMVALANQRSRYEYALRYLMGALEITEADQRKMLDCVNDGNQMSQFKLTLMASIGKRR